MVKWIEINDLKFHDLLLREVQLGCWLCFVSIFFGVLLFCLHSNAIEKRRNIHIETIEKMPNKNMYPFYWHFYWIARLVAFFPRFLLPQKATRTCVRWLAIDLHVEFHLVHCRSCCFSFVFPKIDTYTYTACMYFNCKFVQSPQIFRLRTICRTMFASLSIKCKIHSRNTHASRKRTETSSAFFSLFNLIEQPFSMCCGNALIKCAAGCSFFGIFMWASEWVCVYVRFLQSK